MGGRFGPSAVDGPGFAPPDPLDNDDTDDPRVLVLVLSLAPLLPMLPRGFDGFFLSGAVDVPAAADDPPELPASLLAPSPTLLVF